MRFSKAIHEISSLLFSGKICILCGAGISTPYPSCFPLAGDVINGILVTLYKSSRKIKTIIPTKEAFSERLSTLRFEALLQIIVDNFQSLELLHILFQGGETNFNHNFLTNCLKSKNAVLSTNFDVLIEKACFRKVKIRVASSEREFGNALKRIAKTDLLPWLFKIHGTINKQYSIKATLNQIGKSGIAFVWEINKAEIFDQLMSSHPLLVMGYSGTDDFDIMTRLMVIESNQPIYWINHVPGLKPKILKKSEQKKNLKTTVFESVSKRPLTVINGDAGYVIQRLSLEAFNKDLFYMPEIKKGRNKITQEIIKKIDNWMMPILKNNQGLSDFMIGLLLYQANHRKESLIITESSVSKFNSKKDAVGLSRALTNLSTMYADANENDKAIKLAKKLLQLYVGMGDKDGQAAIQNNIASLLLQKGQWKETLKIYKENIKFCRKSKNKKELSRTLANLGSLLSDLGSYEKAKKLLQKSLKINKQRGDLDSYSNTIGNMGRLFHMQQQLEEARAAYLIALDIKKKLGDIEGQIRLSNNLSALFGMAGNIAEAEKYLKEARKFIEVLKDEKAKIESIFNEAGIELRKGDIKKAIFLLKNGLPKAKKNNMGDREAQAYGNLGLAYYDSKNYKEAHKYLLKAKKKFKKLGREPDVEFTNQNLEEVKKHLRKI